MPPRDDFVRRASLVLVWSLAAVFLVVFIAAHLTNLGHQPGSISEYEIRSPRWLGAAIPGSLALLLGLLAVLEVRVARNWKPRAAGVLHLAAAIALVALLTTPMDLPGSPVTAHGIVHAAIAPTWAPGVIGGVLLTWVWMRRAGARWRACRWIPWLACTALALWLIGFLSLPGFVFGADQRLFFLVTALQVSLTASAILAETARSACS